MGDYSYTFVGTFGLLIVIIIAVVAFLVIAGGVAAIIIAVKKSNSKNNNTNIPVQPIVNNIPARPQDNSFSKQSNQEADNG